MPCGRCCSVVCWHRRAGVTGEDAWRYRLSLGFFSVAAICAGLGLFLHLYIGAVFERTLVSQVVCTEKHCASGGKMQWQSFTEEPFPGSPQPWQDFHFFNLTNAVGVQTKGEKPIYEEVGPFHYRMYREKYNVEFFDSGNKVKYQTRQWFEFDESMSVMSDSAQMTIMNPGYMGVMHQTKGELQLVAASMGPVLREALAFLTTTFATDVISGAVPAQLMEKQNILQKGTLEDFLATWANATSVPGHEAEWADMLVSSLAQRPTGISLTAAQKLWDPNAPLSLTNNTSEATRAWKSPISDATRVELLALFGLTPGQLKDLELWRSQFFSKVAEPFVLKKYEVMSVADIGWKQWADGEPNAGVSVRETYPEEAAKQAWQMAPEVAIWAKDSKFTMPISTAKELLNGTNGVFAPKMMGEYLTDVAVKTNYTKVKELWGLDPEEERNFTSFAFEGLVELSDPRLHLLFKQGGGLFATSSVRSWLWHRVDPLLEFLQPEKKVTNNFNLNQTKADALKIKPSVFWTGKNDPSKIGFYIEWEGQTVIKDIAAVPMPVTCTNEWGMFPPLMKPYDRLCSFNANYARGVKMIPVGNDDIYGVDTIRLMIDNATFAVNETLYQSIQGFANMTGFKQAPVFQSHPHFFNVPKYYRDKVVGVRSPNWDSDLTTINVEPLTGKVVVENKMLQANIYTAPDLEFNFFNFMVPTETFYPLFWAKQGAKMTRDNANEIKTKVYLPLKLEQIGLEYMVPIGATVAVIALVELISVCIIVRRRTVNSVALYTTTTTINSDSD